VLPEDFSTIYPYSATEIDVIKQLDFWNTSESFIVMPQDSEWI
jgi:hypothetical protein